MTNLTQKTTSILTLLLIPALAGGLSLFIHHCQCKGDVQISILHQTGCSHNHAETNHVCCQPCHIKTLILHEQHCSCWNEVLSVKTDNFPGTQRVELSKPSFKVFVASNGFEIIQFPSYRVVQNEKSNDKSPPYHTGKEICIKNRQLKIAQQA